MLALLTFIASAQCQQTAEDWLNKGNEFYEQGDCKTYG